MLANSFSPQGIFKQQSLKIRLLSDASLVQVCVRLSIEKWMLQRFRTLEMDPFDHYYKYGMYFVASCRKIDYICVVMGQSEQDVHEMYKQVI